MVYYIWKNHTGIKEKALINNNGDYIGIKTGTLYSKEEYRHSDIIYATVRNIEDAQNNGMIHLDPSSKSGQEFIEKKKSFIGCRMPFREAHLFGALKVYQSIITGEYYNQNELEIEITHE